MTGSNPLPQKLKDVLSQAIALPHLEYSWKRVPLNNQGKKPYLAEPSWLLGLATDIPTTKWFVKIVSNDPTRDARQAVVPGIRRAELAAIAAALTHKYTHIATDSLSSLHQLRKEILYPEKHRHHVQGDVLKKVSNLARASQGHIFFSKVKSHAGIAGNECADKIAKFQASLKNNNLTDTGIPTSSVCPGGKPFYSVAWLAREEARPSTPKFSSPIPNLVYFSDLEHALKSHMHAKYRLGYVDCKPGYYTYYQSLLPQLIIQIVFGSVFSNDRYDNLKVGGCAEVVAWAVTVWGLQQTQGPKNRTSWICLKLCLLGKMGSKNIYILRFVNFSRIGLCSCKMAAQHARCPPVRAPSWGAHAWLYRIESKLCTLA
eukprot:1144168-Pelagomonas_calceolata.AAC.1